MKHLGDDRKQICGDGGVYVQLRTGNCDERLSVRLSRHLGAPWWTHCANIHQTATANTLTTQYMVRFSHRTVELPARRSVTEITRTKSETG